MKPRPPRAERSGESPAHESAARESNPGPVLDHIAIAVPEIGAALAFWRDSLGARVADTEEVATEKVRVAFLDTGAVPTELLEPTAPDSPIARFLERGGKGLHHVAYRVADIDSALARLRTAGVRLIHESAVPGSRGTRVAFIHPAATGGVLVELVEHAGSGKGERG